MELTKIFIASLMLILIPCSHGNNDVGLKNFKYRAKLVLNEKKSFLEGLANIISDSDLKASIEKLRIFSMKNQPVSSLHALNDRVSKDVDTIYRNLHAEGYYNAHVESNIESSLENEAIVTVRVSPNNRFKLMVKLKLLDQSVDINKFYSDLLCNQLKSRYASLSDIKEMILSQVFNLKNDGFYDPKVQKKRVVIDYKNETAVLHLEILCGPKVKISETQIKSFSGIDDEFVKNRLEWKDGEFFSESKIKASEENLKNTQIFSAVKISPGKINNSNDGLPLEVEVKEDKKHMLDFSLMYSGIRNMNFKKDSRAKKGLKSVTAKASWSRLNAFGHGEKLTLNIEGTPMKVGDRRTDYAFEVLIHQPDVFTKNSKVSYSVGRRQELTNVFFKKSDKYGCIYNYSWTHSLFPSAGIVFEKNYVDSDSLFFLNDKLSKNYKALCIPLELGLNKTDDLLNPTQGYKIQSKFHILRLSETASNNLKYYSITYSYAYRILGSKKNIFAFNIGKKGILGSNIDDIPIDKRIYAGGINSVRGYANQLATEMINGTECTAGGKSALEFNCEFRRQINKDWGGLIFFDGAKIYGNTSRYFKIENKRWFYSVGLGIRYFTGIGPIRLDFAFPIRKRKGVDSKMQFLMSLGQAF
ncbi:MAG: hypothetical protein E7015_03830 [Alphaproteobacteria bacterium]|nr:hypothetical protein [Alphaproteobacteria bacterium]